MYGHLVKKEGVEISWRKLEEERILGTKQEKKECFALIGLYRKTEIFALYFFTTIGL